MAGGARGPQGPPVLCRSLNRAPSVTPFESGLADSTMNEVSVSVFGFQGRAVRALPINDEPWFVANDVAEVLGYSNPSDAISRHCKGVVKRYPLATRGGTQDVRILSEPDVLRLIVGSKLPAAIEFERCVFEEILPSIRKTGHYGATVAVSPTVPADQLAAAQSELLDVQRKLIDTQERLLAATGKVRKRKANRPITGDEVAEMRRLRSAGLPVVEVARRMSRSPGAVALLTRDAAATADLFGGVA